MGWRTLVFNLLSQRNIFRHDKWTYKGGPEKSVTGQITLFTDMLAYRSMHRSKSFFFIMISNAWWKEINESFYQRGNDNRNPKHSLMFKTMTVTLQIFSCIYPVSGNLCKILQEYPFFHEFYYRNDRALDNTFTEIPGSQQKINRHMWNTANFKMIYFCSFLENFVWKCCLI